MDLQAKEEEITIYIKNDCKQQKRSPGIKFVIKQKTGTMMFIKVHTFPTRISSVPTWQPKRQ